MTKQENQFSGPELCRKEAHEVVDLLKKGEVSPKELLEIAQERVEATDKFINAIPTQCWDRAHAHADSLNRYEGRGALYGLPMGIKDLTVVKDVRTTFGTPGFADFIPPVSDPLVEKLEHRGGLVIGKTNTPEFGAGGNTFNEVHGATFNPWDTSLNAGGSSGGAAASLATGQVWLSHGSDHGGSLRTPAAYCGIVGLRPSPGRCGGSSPDQAFMIEGVQGPMARSVKDCALFLDAMSGYDKRFAISYPAPEQSYWDAVKSPNTKPKIAFTMDLNGFAAIDDEMKSHLTGALTALEKAGADVEEASPDTSALYSTYHTLRGLTWATGAKVLPDHIRPQWKKTLEENTRFGENLTVNDITNAQIGRSRIYADMLKLFDRFDVLALPVVGCMPHLQSEEWVSEVGGQKLDSYMDWLRFAYLATTTSLPSISVPVGLGPRGLPVGLQMIGRPRDEAGLLQVAAFVEATMGGALDPIDPKSS